ncbi:hypothetical protein, partial [Pseudomonas hunanensis]
YLPYARALDDATIELRDGRMMQVIRLTGFPFETADSEELNYRKTLRDTMLRGIADARFALYHHVVRREVQPVFEGTFDDPFSQSLDTAWRTKLSSRKLYVNDLFITLVRRPLPGRIGVLQNLVRGSGRAESDARRMRDLVALN